MAQLKTTLGSLILKNPIMTASGTSGNSTELEPYFPLDSLGAFVTKGLSIYPKQGNKPPRITETASGLINSIGLENPGIKAFINEALPKISQIDTLLIANFFGNNIDTYIEAAIELSRFDSIGALELNISCPNVKEGGISFGSNPKSIRQLVSLCRKATRKPITVKLSPNVGNIVECAQAAIEAGADMLTCFNTLIGTDIDIKKRTFKLGAGKGGLSGPAILPVSLFKLHQVASAFPNFPIIGVGGISSGEDVIKYLLAGASAVQIGTATLVNPKAPYQILHETNALLDSLGIKSVKEIIGEVKQA
jgi:dihydroorotate dehydrogenase (NAD+) catalytic subunit